MIIKNVGVLELPAGKDLNKLNFLIHGRTRAGFPECFSLSKFLKEKEQENIEIGLVIHIQGKDIINEIGKVRQYNGLYEINDIVIEHRLWDYTGEYVEVIIDDLNYADDEIERKKRW